MGVLVSLKMAGVRDFDLSKIPLSLVKILLEIHFMDTDHSYGFLNWRIYH